MNQERIQNSRACANPPGVETPFYKNSITSGVRKDVAEHVKHRESSQERCFPNTAHDWIPGVVGRRCAEHHAELNSQCSALKHREVSYEQCML